MPLECREFSKKYNIVNFFDVGAMEYRARAAAEKGLTLPVSYHRRGQPPAPTVHWARLDRRRFVDLAAAWRPARRGSRCRAQSVCAHRQAEPWVSGKDVILHHQQDRRGRRSVQVDGLVHEGARAVMNDRYHLQRAWRSRPVRRTASSVDDKTMDYVKSRA